MDDANATMESETMYRLKRELARMEEAEFRSAVEGAVRLRQGQDRGEQPVTGQGYSPSPIEKAIPGTMEPHLGLQGYNAQELGLSNIEEAMRYQPWNSSQLIAGDEVRDALIHAAKAILRRVPRSPLRTRALNAIIDCRMLANGAITFGGRF